jgi:hypothetical protein
MSRLVVLGAQLECSEGSAPAALTPTGAATVAERRSIATASHHLPVANVGSFGACRSLLNPQVASATAAAQGVLAPQPCVPLLPARWDRTAAAVLVADEPAVLDGSECRCQWGGRITVADPGSGTVVE